jgi:amino acid adenylation domain-containing protein
MSSAFVYERRQAVGSGHHGAHSMTGSTRCIPDLVRQRAAIAPDDLAVRAGAERMSYRDLDVQSNRLANYLRALGVVPSSIVGLSVDRSLDFPVVALAVLKLGAAYLPLEPKAPRRRLEIMLKSAEVSVLVTDCKSADEPTESVGRHVALDRSRKEIESCSSGAPNVEVTPDDTAYVIFTSGSTGIPKAVAVGHASLLNLTRWHIRAFDVKATDRATQLASIGFDAAVWELWPHLAAGASVHLLDDETRTDPEKLRDWLLREKITISFAPTPLAERMLKLPWPKETSLRFLLTGADTLHSYPTAGLPFILVNNYGPTECTVVATSAPVPVQVSTGKLPPIGRAIDNAEIYILDESLGRVQDGTVGEIYVGGDGLAKGYLHDAELTAERFIRNPFSNPAGARLYRTGDLGSYLPDGQISFHGRVDEQVKINGFRIELNDVASALRRHPSIRECALAARENEAGEKQLVAYVVPSTSLPSLGELLEFLGKEIPDYMLPAIFVQLDALPVASSGKVDRLALPVPNEQNMLRDQVFHHPSSATEQRVSAVVASLLGLERVGVNENFFYLGGNSLFGTQLIARLRDAFQVEVPLLSLFDHPTVAELSAEVERLMVAKVDAMSEEEAQRLLSLNTEQASV